MSSKNKILEILKNYIELFDFFENVYLFGSAINSDLIPNDVDVLLVYNEYSDEIVNILKEISSRLEKIIGLPVDFTVLSVKEEHDLKFLKKIELQYLKIK